ncbi:hypothetical protein C2W62_40995, partial [Candidatus Entotheonella serta]
QIGGQAVGPVMAGAMFDYTDSYIGAFLFFAAMVSIGSLLILTVTPKKTLRVPSRPWQIHFFITSGKTRKW